MWLILGGNGQLGKSMSEALSQRGLEFTSFGSAECDIADKNSVDTAFSGVKPSVVVNCAAWTAVDAAEDHEDDARRINCDGARNVAIACRSTGAVMVHVSTDYVFPGTKSGAYLENDATGPQGAYGRSKLCGENAIREEHGDSSYIVRTAWLYSPFGGNFVKTMLRRALTSQPVRVVNDQLGQPTLASDLADHIVDLVVAKAPFGTYHGTNSGQATWFDFSREIFRLATGSNELVSAVGSSEYPTKAVRPANSVLSHSRTTAAGVPKMREWSSALAASINDIIAAVQNEETN